LLVKKTDVGNTTTLKSQYQIGHYNRCSYKSMKCHKSFDEMEQGNQETR